MEIISAKLIDCFTVIGSNFVQNLKQSSMASVWNFVKRHRGKIALGGALVGGAYVTRRILQNRQVQLQLDNVLPSVLGRSDTEKKGYIFDSNQETCDTSIKELVPSIKDKIIRKFDVEALVEQLKECEDANTKVELWNQIKIGSISRLLSAAYGYSLLVASLKVQVSILAGQLYANAKKNEPTVWDQMNRWMGGGDRQMPVEMDSSTQQLFLQCIQYFTLHGLDHLMEKINQMVTQFFDGISLKSQFTVAKLNEIINDIRLEVEAADFRNFSYLIVPLTANQDAFALPHHHNRLEALLNSMKVVLESEKCRKLIGECVVRFCREICDFSQKKCDKFGPESAVPLAKLVPIFTDCIYDLTSLEFNSPLEDILISPSLHNFCLKVFDEFSAA